MKTTYIAFLRGINVGGHRVTMAHLKTLFEDLGFDNVRTYIQSGNVSFEVPKKVQSSALEEKIEKHLSKELGFPAPTIVRTLKELEESIEFPLFKKNKPASNKRHFILLTSGTLPKNLDFPLLSSKKDFEIVGSRGNDLFVILHLDVGKPGNPVIFIEKKFNLKATSRYYHTTEKIVKSAKS